LIAILLAVTLASAGTWHQAVEHAAESVTVTQDRAEAHQDDWMRLAAVATAAMAHARLSGRFEHLAIAEHALEQAFMAAPEGSGPTLLAAELDTRVHRFGAARKRLDQAARVAVLLPADRRRIALLRSRLGTPVQPGTDNDPRTRAAQAHASGELAAARAALAKAIEGAMPDVERWWLCLTAGRWAAQAGDLGASTSWAEQAEQALGGSWQVAHLSAVVLQAEGKLAEAEVLATRAAQSGAPEAYDTLAEVARARGAPQRAMSAYRDARISWETQLSLFPEAAAAGAAAHHLSDLPCSLQPGAELCEGAQERGIELAILDARSNPGVDAIARLGAALTRAGTDPAEALLRAGTLAQ
jgi:tetratricopeptide (TPR) repeat protein